MKKIILQAIVLISGLVFVGCSKENNEAASRKVEYRVTAVKAQIVRIVYTGADGTSQIVGPQAAYTWSGGEVTIPGNISPLKIYAEADDEIGTSSLNVQIYVDGVLKAETTDTDDVANVFEAEVSF